MDIEQEKEQLSHAVETNTIIANALQTYSRENKRLWCVVAVLLAIVVFLGGCIAYQSANMDKAVSEALAEAQETFNQGMIEALNTVAEMEVTHETTTTTTTQTVEGDSATFNNVTGDQYNDSAQNVGGGE